MQSAASGHSVRAFVNKRVFFAFIIVLMLTASFVWQAADHNIRSVRAASGFTPGNLVIYRLGDGSAAPNANATVVFLDEYTPSGTLLQSIAMPPVVDGSQKRLAASGTATSEGLLTLSADGHYLIAA